MRIAQEMIALYGLLACFCLYAMLESPTVPAVCRGALWGVVVWSLIGVLVAPWIFP
jgi:hypothetical protein